MKYFIFLLRMHRFFTLITFLYSHMLAPNVDVNRSIHYAKIGTKLNYARINLEYLWEIFGIIGNGYILNRHCGRLLIAVQFGNIPVVLKFAPQFLGLLCSSELTFDRPVWWFKWVSRAIRICKLFADAAMRCQTLIWHEL